MTQAREGTPITINNIKMKISLAGILLLEIAPQEASIGDTIRNLIATKLTINTMQGTNITLNKCSLRLSTRDMEVEIRKTFMENSTILKLEIPILTNNMKTKLKAFHNNICVDYLYQN